MLQYSWGKCSKLPSQENPSPRVWASTQECTDVAVHSCVEAHTLGEGFSCDGSLEHFPHEYCSMLFTNATLVCALLSTVYERSEERRVGKECRSRCVRY